MNREEAKAFGRRVIDLGLNDETQAFCEIALEALEQKPCDNAVSRQDVLDLAKKGILVSNGNYESVCKAINELPSVTPQPSISQPDIEAIRQEIETEMNLCRMKDTVSKGYKGKILEEVLGKIDKYIQKPQEKWIDEDDNRYICKECEYAHKPQKEPCEDAISRQAVRHILNHEVKMPIKVWKKVFELVDDLPPVTPQPKTGHWITQWNPAHQKEYYYCPECREEYSYDGETGIKMNDYNYCPNCGARMQESEVNNGQTNK